MPGGIDFGGAIAPFQSYTPVLQGATDDPVPTYATRVGRYTQSGGLVVFFFSFTTTTMTKTTLTDQVRITLPVTAKNTSNQIVQCNLRITNGTVVQNANLGLIQPNTGYIEAYQLPLDVALTSFTYAVATGIGVLTNTITYQGSGFYEA